MVILLGQIDKLPDYIINILGKKGVVAENIRLSAWADLSHEGDFCETWILVTDENLMVFEGRREDIEHRNTWFLSEKKELKDRTMKWKETGFKEYSVQNIKKLKAENMISTGMLTAIINGEDHIICCYSNTFSRKFGMLAKLFSKIKEGKELTPEDYKDERSRGSCPKCGMLYPDPERKICPRCLNKKALFVRVLTFTSRHKLQLGLILLCMLVNSTMSLASPYMSGKILYDEVLTEGGKYYGQIGSTIFIMLILQLSAQLLGIIRGRINSKLAAEIIFDIKCSIFASMQKLSLGFFSNKQTGSLMNRVNKDATQLQHFFLDGLPYFIFNLINIISISLIMVSINWKLAILVLIPIPILVNCIRGVYPKLWIMFSRRFKKSSFLNALINDTLSGIRVVKAFGRELSEVERFDAANNELFGINLKLGRFMSTIFPLMGLSMQLGGFIIWGFGGWQVVDGSLSFGVLMTFIGYLSMLYGPIDFMTNIVRWWSDCMNSAERIFEIIDAVPDINEAENPVKLPEIMGQVALKNVTFSYEPNKPVLHNLNFEVKAGEMVGLVGHSGAGKSTITNLITRLYDLEEGSIVIDGVNIKDISISDLRTQIGMVLQETYLFSGTLAENIAFAKPDASIKEIIQAAKIANAHDFIVKLPDGYDTVVGSGNHSLSGGEKQRISIARAILHNPRILILDEATSSLDTETERLIQEALEKLTIGRTTFAIAHRLSTLRNADRLIVIEKGKIVEAGTHGELTALKGVYYKLLQKQREALKIRGVA